MVDCIEGRFEGHYDEVALIIYKSNYDIIHFFKTQGYIFHNFYVFPNYLLFAINLSSHSSFFDPSIWEQYSEVRSWKNKKIKISDNLEKQVFINPTANSLKIKTSKDFWLRLAEKLKKETDYKVVFRSHSPDKNKFKDFSDMKIHDLFLKVFGKNTIVLGIRSGFMDLLKTCDLKKVLLLQSEKDFYGDTWKYCEYSKNKESHWYMHPDFEYFISENFGNQDIEKIIASIKKT